MIYPNLRHFIDTYITANGNKEITGTILNDLLNSMITALGANYQLAGVATPSTNPGEAEQAVMWFASQAGTYTNFGAIVLPLGIHILKWDGTSWTSQTFFTVDNAPTEGSNNLISSDAVAQALKDVIDYIELELVDTTGSSLQANQMNVTLRSNQGTEEEPDYITLASIIFGAATNEKAGLLKAAFNKMLAGGFTYAGIATANASSISSPVDGTFYIGGTGTYTGYAGSAIEVVLGQIVIMKRASNAWSYELITIFQVDDAPTSGSAKLVKSGGTFNAIQNSPQLGYYRCNTAAATAAKTVASENYILPTVGGGCIKIKMTNANTAASGVTLKIGSAEAKPLYYDGQAVSTSNTWQAGETVEVYYDGTNYMANNVAGGGGDIFVEDDNNADLDFADENGKVLVRFSGGHIKTKYFDSSNISPDSGFLPYSANPIRFQIPINCVIPNTTDDTAALQDSESEYDDWGVLLLPESYTPTGKPTRLLIFCHGAGGAVSGNQSQTESLIIAKYFIANGYAVMDMNGLPEAYATAQGINIMNNIGSPFAVSSYIKGYEYVTKNYNIAKDGCFIGGGSMGGISSTNVVMSRCLPIIAHAVMCPVLDTYNQIWLHPWSGGAPKVAMQKIYGLTTDYYETKVCGYNPIVNGMQSYDSNGNRIPSIGAYPDNTVTEYKSYPCPLKIWHCDNDGIVNQLASKRQINAIRNAGGQAWLRTFPLGGHEPMDVGTPIDNPSGNVTYKGTTLQIKPAIEEAFLFINRYNY